MARRDVDELGINEGVGYLLLFAPELGSEDALVEPDGIVLNATQEGLFIVQCKM